VCSEANIILFSWFDICIENGVYRSTKRARLSQVADDDSIWGDEDPMVTKMKECSFEDLRSGAHLAEESPSAAVFGDNWVSLDRGLLARVFHYLKADIRSIQSAASTCKSWYDAALVYKSMCQLIDLSSAGTKCNDMIFRAIMVYYLSEVLSLVYNSQAPHTCYMGNYFILLNSVL
jgi:hypothetical protein